MRLGQEEDSPFTSSTNLPAEANELSNSQEKKRKSLVSEGGVGCIFGLILSLPAVIIVIPIIPFAVMFLLGDIIFRKKLSFQTALLVGAVAPWIAVWLWTDLAALLGLF
jgi:hypothetical protein